MRDRIDPRRISQVCGAASLTNRLGKSAAYSWVGSNSAKDCAPSGRIDAGGIAQVYVVVDGTCCVRNAASSSYVWIDNATSCPTRDRIDAKGISQVCGAVSLTNRLGKSAAYVCVGSNCANGCAPSGRIDARWIDHNRAAALDYAVNGRAIGRNHVRAGSAIANRCAARRRRAGAWIATLDATWRLSNSVRGFLAQVYAWSGGASGPRRGTANSCTAKTS